MSSRASVTSPSFRACRLHDLARRESMLLTEADGVDPDELVIDGRFGRISRTSR